MTRLLLIRHGESVGNARRVICGHADLPLSDLGARQAERTAEYLRHEPIAAVYTSDLQRACETAKRIHTYHPGVPFVTDERLRELFVGVWENLSYDDAEARYAETYRLWFEDIGRARVPRAESFAHLQERISAVLEEIARAHDGKTVCVVSHAMALRVFSLKVLGKPIEKLQSLPFASNASTTEVCYDGAFRMVRYSADNYMGDIVTKLSRGAGR